MNKKINKILQSWQNSKAEGNLSDVFKVIEHFGINLRNAKGSHYVCQHDSLKGHPKFNYAGEFSIPVTKNNKVKNFYLRILILAINLKEEYEKRS